MSGRVLVGLILVALPLQVGWAQQKDQATRSAGFNLFAARSLVIDGNRVQCGIDDQGNICRNTFGSPTGGGGFWPKHTVNQYIFNSGLQIAGIVPLDAGFEWAGDTTGARFFTNAFVNRVSGEAQSSMFSSSDPQDLADWPTGAVIRDPGTFHPALLGRKVLSDQDTWVRYWDGNPALGSARDHPMGLLIEQRTLSFNHPVLNEDIIYLVFTFFNITAADPATYSRLPAAIQPEIARIGADFQKGVLDVLGTDLPDGGFTIDSIYAAVVTDFDVGNAGINASSAVLPFSMGFSYKTDFNEPTWFYPSDINGSPFGPHPGFVGVMFLKTPGEPFTPPDLRLAMYSDIAKNPNFAPGTPNGPGQMWRFFSGNHDPLEGDPLCPVAEPRRRRLCLLEQFPNDTRFRISTGPFSLAPGEAKTLVLAYVFAAPVAAPILPFVNGTLVPGVPPSGEEIFNDPSLVRILEQAAGWAGQNDDNGNGVIEANEVVTVERSLLHKAQLAQSLVDSKFMLPTAPEPPDFFLVPEDGQVTVVWRPSPSETTGDPYFVEASNPNSPLYDPNYRQRDVEGYRIYRGVRGGELELIARFDYAGTTLTDFTGAWDYGVHCAPELGDPYDKPPNCPVNFSAGGSVVHGLAGNIPQVRLPGRAALQFGQVIFLPNKLDSTFAGPGQQLHDSGVPFAFFDNDVQNGVEYVYSVTAFDVNSVNSGPASLESVVLAKVAIPRLNAANQVLPTLITGMFGDDGTELNPLEPIPSLDPDDGTWSGPFPPTNAFTLGFAPEIPRLLPQFTRSATIDSITLLAVSGSPCPAGNNPFGACWQMHLSVDVDGTISRTVVDGYTPWWNAFGERPTVSAVVLRASVDLDSTSLAQFGIPTDVGFAGAVAVDLVSAEAINTSVAAGPHSRRGGSPWFHDGSRWIDGDTEQGATAIPDPSRFIRVGQVSGVDTVWAPISHTPFDFGLTAPSNGASAFEKQCFIRATALMARAADTRFVWGGGTFRTFSEVRDITHQVDVQFSPKVGPTWGFVADGNGNGFIDWQDFNFIDGAIQVLRQVGGGSCDQAAGTSWDPGGTATATSLSATPRLTPVSTQGLGVAGVSTLTATGRGFGLYVNGERFIFEANTLPARGTTWTLRQFWGNITVTDGNADDPSGYAHGTDFGGAGGVLPRSMMVPGLTFQFEVANSTQFAASTDSTLETVHTVPDPYYVLNAQLETPRLSFVNLPHQAIIRIYSVSGILVDILEHFSEVDGGAGGVEYWNVRSRNDRAVASGVYFYHIETPEGLEKVGRFTIVNASGVVTGGDLTR